MGCQLESQGAALEELQKRFAAKGVLLCGLDRIEHPYDVEDYLRHFGFSFPVFVDMGEESPGLTSASLGSIAILDRDRKRARVAGKAEFEPVQTKAALEKLLASVASSGRASSPPGVLSRSANGRNYGPPQLSRGWTAPVRLGAGKYPRIVAFGNGRLLCAWVTGEVPQQQLEYTVYSGGKWEQNRRVSTGPDAHAAALDVNADGHPVMVWAQRDPKGYRVYLSTWDGADWHQPVAVSPSVNDAFRPDVFCPPSGGAVVAWYGWKRVQLKDYPNAWWRSIFVCELAGNQVGAPRELAELLRGSDDCWDPVITGTGQNLRVSWLRDENPPKLWSSARGSAAWSRPEGLLKLPPSVAGRSRVQSASAIRSAGSRRGLVFEMFTYGGTGTFRPGLQVYLVQSASEGWAKPTLLSSATGHNLAPVGVEVTQENLLAFWCHMPGQGKSSTIRMRAVKPEGENTSPEQVIVTGESSNSYPAATLDRSGTVWLAWQNEETDAAQAIYSSGWQPGRP